MPYNAQSLALNGLDPFTQGAQNLPTSPSQLNNSVSNLNADAFGGYNGYSNPFSDNYNQQNYNPYAGYGAMQPNEMPTDQWAGNPYTGSETYAPEAANPDDYWNQRASGYDQMPEYGGGATPYNYNIDPMAEYQQGDLNLENSSWDNAYNYAPWSGYSPGGNTATAWELAGQQGFGAEGGRNGTGYYNAGQTGFTDTSLGVLTGGISGLFGKKKKSPNFQLEVPSYQGHMFTPEEGFPDYYRPSQETSNQTQSDMYQQNAGYSVPGMTGDSGGYDYNYGGQTQTPSRQTAQQDYIGQNNNYGSLYSDAGQNSLYQTFKPGEYGG